MASSVRPEPAARRDDGDDLSQRRPAVSHGREAAQRGGQLALQVAGLVDEIVCAGTVRAQDQVRVAGTDGHDRDVDRFAEPSHDGSGLLMVGGEHDDDCVGRLLRFGNRVDGDDVAERAVVARSLERLPQAGRLDRTIRREQDHHEVACLPRARGAPLTRKEALPKQERREDCRRGSATEVTASQSRRGSAVAVPFSLIDRGNISHRGSFGPLRLGSHPACRERDLDRPSLQRWFDG